MFVLKLLVAAPRAIVFLLAVLTVLALDLAFGSERPV